MADIFHSFNKKQSIEKEVKDLYLRFTVGNPTAASDSLNLTDDITLTASTTGTSRNTNTFTTQVIANAANPSNTVLATFSGTAAAIVCTITPNDGTNNSASVAATASIATTAPIVLTSVVKGTVRNTNTFTIQVLAAAANPTNKVLVDITGTAAAIVCTVTPNDGTNNAATPVDLTTAELVTLIGAGSLAKVNLTDASGLLNDQTATGGGATALADGGEGDGLVGTFSAGSNTVVSLTTAELAELINTGAVVGKTVTVTDASSRRTLQTATGGGVTLMVDAGEGDGVVATFTGGDGNLTSIDEGYGVGISSVTRTNTGEYEIVLQDKYPSLKFLKGTILSATAIDGRVQVKSEAVSTTKTIVILTLTGATATDLTDGAKIVVQMDVKNTAQPF